MTPPAAVEPSHAVLEQAAEWFARLRDGRAGGAERAAWQAWLHAAEEHRAAWRYVEDISRGFAPLQEAPGRRDAADALATAAGRLRARRRILTGVAALAGTGLAGWLGWRQALLPAGLLAWAADVRTGTGEQRDVTLADGSRLWLNTASAVNLRLGAQERRVRLVAGEVFVETAQGGGDARPFLVETAHGRMRALGTRFNVRLDGGQTHLAVYEGAVEIRTGGSGTASVVAAGQQARFDAGRIAPAEAADAAREAWAQGTLVADDIPLREVVQELRRYRSGHIGVADSVADLRVYGNFPIHDTDRVLRMLAAALPVRIEQRFAWWVNIEAQ